MITEPESREICSPSSPMALSRRSSQPCQPAPCPAPSQQGLVTAVVPPGMLRVPRSLLFNAIPREPEACLPACACSPLTSRGASSCPGSSLLQPAEAACPRAATAAPAPRDCERAGRGDEEDGAAEMPREPPRLGQHRARGRCSPAARPPTLRCRAHESTGVAAASPRRRGRGWLECPCEHGEGAVAGRRGSSWC